MEKTGVKVLVLGDSHGLHPIVEEVVEHVAKLVEFDVVVHVGDFGCYPFAPTRYVHPCNMDKVLPDVPKYFVRGNHEDHEFLAPIYHNSVPIEFTSYPGWHYVPDGVLVNDMYFVGGAWSIDAARRNRPDHPFRWYHNEQIDRQHEDKILDFFEKPENINKIRLMVTHDAPLELYPQIVDGLLSYADYKTPRLFDHLVKLFNRHLDHEVTWVFGHLGKSHMSPNSRRDGAPTKFKIGKVNFLLLDVIRDYVEMNQQCDSWTVVQL